MVILMLPYIELLNYTQGQSSLDCDGCPCLGVGTGVEGWLREVAMDTGGYGNDGGPTSSSSAASAA